MKQAYETSAEDALQIQLEKIGTDSGNLVVCSTQYGLTFSPKRIYYLYDIPAGEHRGGHAHKNLHQLLVAVSGTFNVEIDDGREKKVFYLNNPSVGLLIRPGLWRVLSDFSGGSTCLVLASEPYDESDYIRDYQEFLNFKVR